MHDTMNHDTSLYSTTDVARKLGINRRRVQQLAREMARGQLVGNSLAFNADDVAAFQQRRTTPGRVPRQTVVSDDR